MSVLALQLDLHVRSIDASRRANGLKLRAVTDSHAIRVGLADRMRCIGEHNGMDRQYRIQPKSRPMHHLGCFKDFTADVLDEQWQLQR